jgi:hypothetical protein
MRHAKKKRNIDEFTRGNIRQIIYRRYSRGKIHAVGLEM